MPSDPLFWGVLLGLAGAIIGSFLATLVVRWPEDRSVVRGRSACDGCGRVLRPWQMVPIASALVLRGRCAACESRIDPVQPGMEIACAALGFAAGWVAPGGGGVAGAAFGWGLATLAMLDWRAFWLPNRLVLLLAAGGLASGLAGYAPESDARLIGGAAGFALLWAVREAYRRIRGREGMGGGDPKLLGAIGLWIGWRMLPAVLVVAGLVGLGIVAVRAAGGRRMAADDALPFGTLLAVAAYPAWWMMVASAP